MANHAINIGAQVIGINGEQFGRVEDITDEGFIVRDGDLTTRFPFDFVDSNRSSSDELFLKTAFERSEMTSTTIPVHEEEMHVRVREVDRGRIIIEKSVESVPYREQIDIANDVVEIDRIPIDVELDEMPQARQEGHTLIVPVVEEVLVVMRKYRVIEEVHVTRRQEIRTELIEDELRREDVTVHEEYPNNNS